MKNRLYFIVFLLVALAVSACKDDNNDDRGAEPYLTIDPDDDIEFGAEGGSVTITVDTNLGAWKAVSDRDWCEVTASEGKFTITAAENATVEDMPAAVVTVSAGEGASQIIETLKVTQRGEEYFLTVAVEGPTVFPWEGGEALLTVETNCPGWSVDSGEAWCLVTEVTETGFKVSAGLNNTTEPMPVARVTVKAEGLDDDRVVEKEIVFNQNGRDSALDAAGTSNCYIVGYGTYSFDARVTGNGIAGIIDGAGFHTSNAVIAPVSAALLWQDRYTDGAGFITSVSLGGDGRVSFSTSDRFEAANAVIAVYDASGATGNILWSWHIWRPGKEAVAMPVETGYEVMNMNVGAWSDESGSADSFGMLYQWGRKDPFPAADVLSGDTNTKGRPIYNIAGETVSVTNSSWYNTDNNTLAYSIANPTVCLSNYSQYSASKDWLKSGTGVDALWGNPAGNEKDEENKYINKGSKSIYDPCPAGWRVPPADVFRRFTTSGGYTWAGSDDTVPDFNIYDRNGDGTLGIDDYHYGWFFMLGGGEYSYFPAAARFDGSYAMLMGSMTGLWGSYWGNAPTGDGTGFAVLSFQVKDMSGNKAITASPSGSAPRADAYSVRCIRE